MSAVVRYHPKNTDDIYLDNKIVVSMSRTAWPPETTFAWNLVPYYNQAAVEGVADAFFDAVFPYWFERFPFRLEDFEDTDLMRHVFEAEKKKVRKMIERYKFYNREAPECHWTFLFDDADLLAASKNPEGELKGSSPEGEGEDSIVPASLGSSANPINLVTPVKLVKDDRNSDKPFIEPKKSGGEGEASIVLAGLGTAACPINLVTPTKPVEDRTSDNPFIENSHPNLRGKRRREGEEEDNDGPRTKHVCLRPHYRRSPTPLPSPHQFNSD